MSKARELANLGNAYSDGALSNRNLIINGAMQVAQRGTSATGNGYKTVDRMNLGGGTTANTDVSQAQQVLSSSDTPYAEGFRYSWKMTNNTATSNNNDYVEPTYQFENQDLVTSGWEYTNPNSNLTLQFWVKSSLAGTYYVRFLETSGTLHSYVSPVTLEAGVWKKVVVTITGDAALDIPLNNGTNFRINFNIYYGPDFTDNSCPLNQWHVFSGPAEYPDFLQNWKNTAGATFEITGVQLEVGDTATPFEHRSYGQELALCQRYYEIICEGTEPFGTATSWTGGHSYISNAFKTEKRAIPTVSYTGDVYIFSTGGSALSRTPISGGSIFTRGYDLLIDGGSATGFVRGKSSSTKIAADAEL